MSLKQQSCVTAGRKFDEGTDIKLFGLHVAQHTKRACIMEVGPAAGEEGCIRCKEVPIGSVAFFCPGCGRQIKPVPEGKLVFRAAEGSAEKAWKSFGFADAHAPSKRARAGIMGGNDSAKRVASLALAATKSNIERTVAPPTLEQARVMGVESVVEGVDWKLSTDQLQVLALARSGALRGRRRASPGALPQPSPVPPKSVAATTTTTPKRRKAKRKPKDGRANPTKHESSVDWACVGNEQQGKGISTQRSSGRRGSDKASKSQPPAEPSAPSEEGPESPTSSFPDPACAPTSLKRQSHRTEAEETPEQLVAVARGGVRHAGKVFHRRGVKLTEDSPRSMIPRDAFRAAGLHLLGQKELSVGRHGLRRILVAELSAVVRVVPVDTDKAAGLAEATSATRRSQLPSGEPLVESSFACVGVRLEVRPPRRCCLALHGERALDACLEHANQFPSGIAKIEAAAAETVAAFRDDSRGGGGSSGSTLEERGAPRPGGEGDDAVGELLLPRVPSLLPATSAAGLAGSPHDCSAASAGGRRCEQRSEPVAFSQDFTHVELDALLGPTSCWKDPFEESRITVSGLEASWTACLDSLCGRLRVTVPEVGVGDKETDGGRPPGEEEALITPEAASEILAAEKRGALPALTDVGSRGKAEGQHQEQCVEERLVASTDVEGQGSPAVPVAAGGAVTTGHPTHVFVSAGDDGEPHGRAVQVQALPLVRRSRRRARGRLEEDAVEGIWFDKTILRVGARVPWGRLHRGRFAKVLFSVSLGESGNGLEFAATSNSPTADPMLRGCWDFRATDRDLARYLSSGYAAVNRAKHRARSRTYDPQRCAVELQERGELQWACAVIARTAFRLVMVVPGGVILSLAGVAIVGGREVAWPQDIEEDRMLHKAASDIQRAWRGCIGRKRARWLRMEREGRRRLSRMRKEAEDKREKARLAEEEEAKAELALEEERRTRAQIVLAAATRGQAARREASLRRAERSARQRELDEEAAAERQEAEKAAAACEAQETAVSEPRADGDQEDSDTPGVARLERVVTIDGTEVHLTAHVKEAAAGGGGDGGEGGDQPMEMLLVAVDKKARRSSRLSLDAADIGEIVDGAHQDSRGLRKGGPQGVLSAVLRKLTLFNSRRKDLFILSYRGKKVIAPH